LLYLLALHLHLRSQVLGPPANGLWSVNLSCRLAPRRVAYSFALRLLCGFAPRLLLSASRLTLLTRCFSLSLLELTSLALSISIVSCSFGVKPVYFSFASLLFLLATLFCLLRCPAIIPGIPVIPGIPRVPFELLVPRLVRDTFHAHRLRQVPSKPRVADLAAHIDWCLPEFLRDARRQIDLAATPR
jgi:hypothetical protein